MAYRIEIRRQATKDLPRIERMDRQRIAAAIDELRIARALRDARSFVTAKDGAFELENIGFSIPSRKKGSWCWL